MWFSVTGGDGCSAKVLGPCESFIEATESVASLPAAVRCVVVEWSIMYGPLSILSRLGDRFELLWELSGVERLRGRDERPVNFERRSTADDRRKTSKRLPGAKGSASAVE